MNSTINISLPRGLIDFANRQVDSGYYSSVSEIIRDALRRLLFLELDIPVYEQTEKMNRIDNQAVKEYKQGQSIKFKKTVDLIS